MRTRVVTVLFLVSTAAAAACFAACSSDGVVQSGSDSGSDTSVDALVPDTGAPVDAGSDVVDASLVTCAVSPCAVAIATGFIHACALMSDETVRCWGNNAQGQLANPIQDGGGGANQFFKPVTIQGIGPVAQIVAGTGHTCVLLKSGDVECWGDNQYGQLGEPTDGSASSLTTPVKVALPGKVTQLMSAGFFTCALLTDKTLSCWGSNSVGQCGVDPGDAGLYAVSMPTTTAGQVHGAIELGGAWRVACARFADGGVSCFGHNANGMLGQGTADSVPHPVAAPALIKGAASHVSRAAGYEGAVILASGGAQGWGYNVAGQVGVGTSGTDITSPTDLPGSSTTIDVSPGSNFGCGLHADGTVWCWGTIAAGQVGVDPASTDASFQLAPHQVSGLSNVVQLASGWYYFGCALDKGGTVRCWGSDQYAQLGRTADAGMDFVAAPVVW